MSYTIRTSVTDHEFQALRISALTKARMMNTYSETLTENGIEDLDITDNTKIEHASTSSKSSTGLKNVCSDRLIVTEDGTFTLSRLLHENELKRRENTTCLLNFMLRKMASKRAEIMQEFWHEQELEYEKKVQKRQKYELELLQELRVNNETELEKIKEKNRIHSENVKAILEKQLESTRFFAQLHSSFSQICENHQEITSLLRMHKDLPIVNLNEYDCRLTSILTSMNIINEKCKNFTISASDIHDAKILESKIKELKTIISEEIVLILNRGREKESNHEEKTISDDPEKSNIIINEIQDIEEKVLTCNYYSEPNYNRHLRLKKIAKHFEDKYRDLLNDTTMKKFRFDCQKAVNTPVNAISSIGGDHVRDKFEKLSTLLSGGTVTIGNSCVSTNQHPQALYYCKDLLARKIVSQGELLVSSNPDAAFPIASVTVALWAKFPDFGELLCAHFEHRCPYLVPMMMPRLTDQTDEEFYKSRGYIYENGVEKQDKFLKRMSGIFRLCFAIWVVKMPRSVNANHPQYISYAWRWLASFIRLDSETDISATALYDFIIVCGSDCLAAYKQQFIKILNVILTDYMEKLNKIDQGGPKTRLDVLMRNIIDSGKIAPPAGLQSVHEW